VHSISHDVQGFNDAALEAIGGSIALATGSSTKLEIKTEKLHPSEV
jgi:hypothetical protein